MHKQIGLRAIRDALARLENAPELAAELAASAERHLELAEALERRAEERSLVELVHELLGAAPDMPQGLRRELADYSRELLGREALAAA